MRNKRREHAVVFQASFNISQFFGRKGVQTKTRSDVTVGKLVWARLFWIADDQAEFPEVSQRLRTSKPLARNDVADDIAFRI